MNEIASIFCVGKEIEMIALKRKTIQAKSKM